MSTSQYAYPPSSDGASLGKALGDVFKQAKLRNYSGTSNFLGADSSSIHGVSYVPAKVTGGNILCSNTSQTDSLQLSASAAYNHRMHSNITGAVGIPGASSPVSSLMSGPSSASTISSNFSFLTSRNRYYLSKSFDIEDDLEFCPEIPESQFNGIKKFNPYTASVFSPSQDSVHLSRPESPNANFSSRSHTPHTPRTNKALEIVNPQTRMRVASPPACNK